MHAAERSEGGGGAERRLRQCGASDGRQRCRCGAVFKATAAEGRAHEAAGGADLGGLQGFGQFTGGSLQGAGSSGLGSLQGAGSSGLGSLQGAVCRGQAAAVWAVFERKPPWRF